MAALMTEQPSHSSPEESALLFVNERLAHYKKQLAEKKAAGQYQLEESVTLVDGGQLLHIQTDDGSIYHLKNGQRWLFLERGQRFKTLYVCEVDEQGASHLNHNTTLLQ